MKKSVILLFPSLILINGCSKPSAEEMFKKGVDAQLAGQYNDAIASYDELIKTYPDSTRTPEAYYAVGMIYQNYLKSYHRAIDMYRQLADKYPAHPTSPNAMFLIGFIYGNELKNIDSARVAYQEFLNRYPDNQLSASARFELANLGKEPGDILEEQNQTALKGRAAKKKAKR
jgi:TolA-binding protein